MMSTMDIITTETKTLAKSKSIMIYTASGFRTDIETLYAKFDDMKSTKFVVFIHCFKEMNFGLIFRGRHNDNEMHEFIDEIYLEVLSQLVNKDKLMSHRICSVYLLYALYVKQPFTQSLKIRFDIKVRITLDQLKIIREFIDKCKHKGYLDVCYIWYKLLSIGVNFVYYRYQSIGPSNTRSVHYYLFNNSHSLTDKTLNDFKESLIPRIETLETTHEMFIDYKEKVFNGKDFGVEEKPNVINHELWKDSINNFTKLTNDFKYNRDIRGRGRPSIWMPYRKVNDKEIEDNNNNIDYKVSVHKKAIKSKVKLETDTSSHILWTDDIIGNLKKGKEMKARLKREKKNKDLKQLKGDKDEVIIKKEINEIKPKRGRKPKTKN
ncbi:uncharacterized protein LOC128963600 [Oppia nitens]|uniref:uncharacterized protein LOC128963600 n=1 Tax=Oppia nitens TaxID=1686743 RepID=UPI0023DA0D79|nr:uncharacterized protein LOC128963600 [Oppia nitens]